MGVPLSLFRNRIGSKSVVNRIFRAQRPFLFEREFPSTRREVGQLLVVTSSERYGLRFFAGFRSICGPQ